jgi:hypothetical protein
MKKGDLVRAAANLNSETTMNSWTRHFALVPSGSIGVIITDDRISWGSCDHQVYFSCVGHSCWVWRDEIELVGKEE